MMDTNETTFDLHRKIFVGNIGYRVSTKDVEMFFGKFGKIINCFIPKDHYRKRSRGIAFITFSTTQEADIVLQALDESLILQGRLLRVNPAEKSTRVDTRRFETCLLNENDSNTSGEVETEVEAEESSFNIDLPDELWEKIFSFLPLRARVWIERVCHRWKNAALRVWKRQTSLDFIKTFKGFESLTDRILNSLLKRCGPMFTCLDLSSSPRLLTDYSMQIINKYCCRLTNLDLSGVNATNISLRDLTVDIHSLKWVRLNRCVYIGEKGLWWLFHNNKELEYIDIKGNIKLTGQCFHMLGPNVKTMILTECKKLCDVGIEKIKERCNNLQELYITDCCSFTNTAINTITMNFTNLKILHCGGSLHHVSEQTWYQLQYMICLEELSLSQNCGLNNEAVIAISNGCYNLRILDLSGCHHCLTDEGIQSLSLLPNLQSLNISYLHQITDISLNQISTTGKLKQLICRACSGVTDSGVEDIVFNCINLKLVDVSGCLQITNKLIKTVISLRQDKDYCKLTLNVGGTSVIPEALVLPPSLQVCLQDFSSYYLRPDKDFLLPEKEEEDDDIREDAPFLAKPKAAGVLIAAGYEENIWQEEHYEGQFDDITEEFLQNDDSLAAEKWEMS